MAVVMICSGKARKFFQGGQIFPMTRKKKSMGGQFIHFNFDL